MLLVLWLLDCRWLSYSGFAIASCLSFNKSRQNLYLKSVCVSPMSKARVTLRSTIFWMKLFESQTLCTMCCKKLPPNAKLRDIFDNIIWVKKAAFCSQKGSHLLLFSPECDSSTPKQNILGLRPKQQDVFMFGITSLPCKYNAFDDR